MEVSFSEMWTLSDYTIDEEERNGIFLIILIDFLNRYVLREAMWLYALQNWKHSCGSCELCGVPFKNFWRQWRHKWAPLGVANEQMVLQCTAARLLLLANHCCERRASFVQRVTATLRLLSEPHAKSVRARSPALKGLSKNFHWHAASPRRHRLEAHPMVNFPPQGARSITKERVAGRAESGWRHKKFDIEYFLFCK